MKKIKVEKKPVKKPVKEIKEVKEEIEEVKEVEKAKDYFLSISVNDSTESMDTDSIYNSLKEFAVPDFIKTEVVIKVTKGNVTREKVFNVFEGRRLFGNPVTLEIFATKLNKELE